MKSHIISILIVFAPLLLLAQSSEEHQSWGLTLNSSFNGEVDVLRISPSVLYTLDKHQFEFGIGINPAQRKDQKLISSELNYKFFPNGQHKKYNLFLMSGLTYINNKINTYYPTKYHYIFLNIGYGFVINLSNHIFLGTNMNFGTYTFGKNLENPYDGVGTKKLFDEFNIALECQFSVGYRF